MLAAALSLATLVMMEARAVRPPASEGLDVALDARFVPDHRAIALPGGAPWIMPAPLAAPAGGMPKLCVKTLNGCRVARVGAGIFIGKISAPRPQYAAEANPRYMSSLYAGVKTPGGPGGMHLRGSLFLSEEVGLHLQVKAGNGFFAGVGLVFRGWF